MAVTLLAGAIALRAAHGASVTGALSFAPTIMTFATVGAVVLARMPRNLIGRLLLAFAVLPAALLFLDAYATGALGDGRAARGSLAAWAFTVLLEVSWAPLIYLLLLFPHGRTLSTGWRWLSTATAVLIASGCALSLFGPVNFTRNFPDAAHPLPVLPAAVAEPLYLAVETALLAVLLGCAVQLVVRFSRSRGAERQQLKWFAFAVALLVAAFLGAAAAGVEPVLVTVWFFPLVPIAVGVAVLRYRLYELDRIVSRTVSYALLSGLLVAVYAGAVLLLRGLLAPVTHESELAVAASTLLVAALFHPLRRRVQVTVDQRFNRDRYDARRTLEAFAAQLRQDVELDDVERRLMVTVKRSVQPTTVGLWLDPTPSIGRHTGQFGRVVGWRTVPSAAPGHGRSSATKAGR